VRAVDEEQIEEIKYALRLPECAGILGGRPRHAIYFVGYRDDTQCLLGLDPHTTYNAIDTRSPSDEILQQIHVQRFETLSFTQIDPSMAFAFFFNDRVSFEQFALTQRLRADQRLRENKFALFHVQQIPPDYAKEEVAALAAQLMLGEDEDDEDDDMFIVDGHRHHNNVTGNAIGSMPRTVSKSADNSDSAASRRPPRPSSSSSSSITTTKDGDDDEDYEFI
jgi:hypothetical protein